MLCGDYLYQEVLKQSLLSYFCSWFFVCWQIKAWTVYSVGFTQFYLEFSNPKLIDIVLAYGTQSNRVILYLCLTNLFCSIRQGSNYNEVD